MNYLYGSLLTGIGLFFMKSGIEKFANINDNTYFLIGGNKENTNIFSENKRLNFNFGKYPPCFNLSFEAQQILETLAMEGISHKYHQLFDLYSILLCQKYHASYKECNPEMLQERIDDVEKMMPKYFDQPKYRTKISKYIKLDSSNISKLIFMCFYLIEQQMKTIKDDKIINLNRKFYFATFKELQTLCRGY